MDGMVGRGIYLGVMREDLISVLSLEWGESPKSPNFHTAVVRFSLDFRLPTRSMFLYLFPIFLASQTISPAAANATSTGS
jgi:hypothetical protein